MNFTNFMNLMNYNIQQWLPTTKKEVEQRGWNSIDVILFSGDAYVDHPSFGAAVIGRLLESLGLKVAIVPQPNWQDDLRDFKKLGKPNLFFGISPGCIITRQPSVAVRMTPTRPVIVAGHVPICPPSFIPVY